jgi:biotin carboxylase
MDKYFSKLIAQDLEIPVPKFVYLSKDDEFDINEITFGFPVIVKPVDAAGSKGVTKVENKENIEYAIQTALSNSISESFIIEDFIEQTGFSSDTDCFSVDGQMKFYSFSNQRFDVNATNPYTPSAYSWPSTISIKNKEVLKIELQRLIQLLDLGTSIYNIEVREGIDGKAYIMEVSPRGGGNRLSEVLKYATDIDLIKNAVKAAVGYDLIDVSQNDYKGYWAEIILHANQCGYFQRIDIDNHLKNKYVVELDLWVKQGDRVFDFNAANNAIGTLILKFETQKKLEEIMNSQEDWLKIIIF